MPLVSFQICLGVRRLTESTQDYWRGRDSWTALARRCHIHEARIAVSWEQRNWINTGASEAQDRAIRSSPNLQGLLQMTDSSEPLPFCRVPGNSDIAGSSHPNCSTRFFTLSIRLHRCRGEGGCVRTSMLSCTQLRLFVLPSVPRPGPTG